MDRFGQKLDSTGLKMLLKPPGAPETEKQRESSLGFKIKIKQKEQQKIAGCSTEEEESRRSGSSSSAASSRAAEEVYLIPCNECDKFFPSLKALFGHLRVHRKAHRAAKKPATPVPPPQQRQMLDEDFMAAEALMMMRHSQLDIDIMEAKLCLLQWEKQEEVKINEEKKNLLIPMVAVMPENVQLLTAMRRRKKMKKAVAMALDFDLNEPAEVEWPDQ